MRFDTVTGVTFSQFEQNSRDKKVILLYPGSTHRNVFLAYLLAHAQDSLYYYCPESPHTTLSGLISDISEQLSLAIKLDMAGQNAFNLGAAVIDELASQIASRIGNLQSGRVVLLMDELDQIAVNSDFRTFILALVRALPDHVQLVINARILTLEPWAQMLHSGDATVWGTAFRSNDLMFTVEDPPRPQLEVLAFGQGHGYMNGREILQWDGALPRNLFFLFMDCDQVSRDDIFEIFWPGLSVKDATNVFHVTKRKITERMSELVADDDNYELTRYSGGFYVPSDKVSRHYDVAEFEAALEQIPDASNDAERAALYNRALDVYTAPFLETVDMPWVVERRKKLAEKYVQALIGMGKLQQSQANYAEALGFYLRALRQVPHREDVYHDVMLMYWRLKRHDDAISHYRRLETYLDTTFGLPPSRKTRDLLADIQEDQGDSPE